MSNRKQPKCPECEKLADVSVESNKIGDFLEWLRSKDMRLAEWTENDDPDTEDYMPHLLMPLRLTTNQILAWYYDIDLDKVEKERRALLEWLQEVQGG